MLRKTNINKNSFGGLDSILDSKAKAKLLKFFAFHGADFKVTGSEASRRAGISVPSAHEALKDLYGRGVLCREIIGRQHIYSLNSNSRIVKDVLLPAFKKDFSLKKDIKDFLTRKTADFGIKNKINSLALYGSFPRGEARIDSDVDVAVVIKKTQDIKAVEDVFIEKIYPLFYEYFGTRLDAYIKPRGEFISRLKKKQPPLVSFLDSYSLIFGDDPINMVVHGS